MERTPGTPTALRALAERRDEPDSLEVKLCLAALRRDLGHTVPESTTLGRFTVVRALGRGGQGDVYEGFDPQLRRRVALKLSRSRSTDHRRSEFEAQALARVRHPNLVDVYSLEVCEGRPIVVMELVEGLPLLRWVERARPPLNAIVDASIRLGEGLKALHDADLTHRDVKPDNVLVDDDGQPRLVDLGLAANAGDDAGGFGTPRYAAPEQLEGAPADPTADQYALAATLAAALRQAGHRVPRYVQNVITRGMARDPGSRFPDVAALIMALRRGRRRRSVVRGTLLGTVLALGLVPLLPSPPGCARDGEAWRREAWSATHRNELQQHLETMPDAGGPESFAAADASLERYAQRWVDATETLCAAPTGHRWDDARARCLDEAAAEFESVVEEIAALDRHTVSVAPQLATDLPRPEACIDGELRWLESPPYDRAALDIRRQVSVARRQCQYGLTPDCAADYEAIETAASEAGVDRCAWEPTVLIELGQTGQYGRTADDAVDLLGEAVLSAERCGRDDAKLTAQRVLAELLARRGQHEDAVQMLRAAEATVVRMGDPTSDRVALLASRVSVFIATGQPARADDAAKAALALHDTLRGAPTEERATLLSMRAGALYELGQFELSFALNSEALELERSRLGDHHPLVAEQLANLSIAISSTDPARARALNARAIEIFEANGDGHELPLGICLSYQADHERKLGEFPKALALSARAVDLLSRAGSANEAYMADALRMRSKVFRDRGDLDGAWTDIQRAHEILMRTRGPTDLTTLAARANMGSIAVARGDTTRGRELGCSARDRFIATYGTEHPLLEIFDDRCPREPGA